MKNHRCINGMLQGTDKYSAPVPLIGLYIASASAVCTILMLLDIKRSYIKKQRWISCTWFKLNSVTLSLVWIAVKLTVDMTTSMPTTLDQLSKLAGTTLLLIYMCYIFLPIPEMKDSTNMFALSILVITVVVNICTQIYTGVIALFLPEHITIMFLLLVVLVMLWHLHLTEKTENSNSVSYHKSRFLQGTEIPASFFQRLKDCFLGKYKSNPQIVASRRMDCGVAGDLSLVSLVILIQAAVRSTVWKKEILCTGQSSDYRWSMKIIVVTQFAFIITGSTASFFRRCSMARHMDRGRPRRYLIPKPYSSNPIWKGKFILVIAADEVYLQITSFNWFLFSVPTTLFSWFISKMRYFFTNDNTDNKTFKEFWVRFINSSDEWIKRKSESDMEKLERSKRKSTNLSKLLSKIIPPELPAGHTGMVHPKYQGPRPRELIETGEGLRSRPRLLLLVVLVKIMEVVLPESLSQNIVMVCKEAFEILHFIEKHMHDSSQDLNKSKVAKVVWITAGSFSRLLPVNLRSSHSFPPSVDHAFSIIEHIHKKMGADDIGREVLCLEALVKRRTFSSVEELGYFLEDIAVELLNPILAQLPEAICKAMSGSPDDKFEKRVRQSLAHFFNIQSWDGICRWKVPNGYQRCLGLLNSEVPPALHFLNGGQGQGSVLNQDPPGSQNYTITSEMLSATPTQDEGQDHPGTLNEGDDDILRSEEHHISINDNEEDDTVVEVKCISSRRCFPF